MQDELLDPDARSRQHRVEVLLPPWRHGGLLGIIVCADAELPSSSSLHNHGRNYLIIVITVVITINILLSAPSPLRSSSMSLRMLGFHS